MNAIYKLDALKVRQNFLSVQLEIYKNEHKLLTANEMFEGKHYVGLVFTKQPRSQPIKRRAKRAEKGPSKKMKAQFMFDVLFVTGAITTFEARKDSIVPSLTILEDARAKILRGSAVGIECVSLTWTEGGVSLAVVFPDGTQVIPSFVNVTLDGVLKIPHLGKQMEAQGMQCRNPNPVVITTNENQWEHAEGRLLRRQLFGDIDDDAQVSCGWTFFSNCLLEFFMRATRQDLLDCEMLDLDKASLLPQPQRSLSGSDLEYLHAKGFDKNPQVSLSQFQSFWEWFGPLSHQYRHNQVIRNLYLRGLIYGFISKDDCVKLLQNQKQGTFLIRSSESSTIGEFTLAFVNARLAVKHHKIDHKKLK